MSLFRKRISSADAFEAFLGIVSAGSEASEMPRNPAAVAVGPERIVYERAYVSLFAILLGLKFCRQADWRLNGQDLFTAIATRVVRQQAERSGVSAVVEEKTMNDRLAIYNVALESASAPSAETMSREIGSTFATLLGNQSAGWLADLGAATFTDTFNRVVDITTSFKL